MKYHHCPGIFWHGIVAAAVFVTATAHAQSTMSLDIGGATYTINKELYGALMEDWGRGIYTGVYVGAASSIPNTNGMRNDVIAAFKDAGVTCLDWPGGCFAERYDWKDGLGPKNSRPGGDMINGLGTAEYFQLCSLVNSVPYITANMTSETPAVMAAWLNHIDSLYPGRLKYWKIGNEIWGGCGVTNTVTYYCNRFEQYEAAIPSKFSGKLFRIADGGSGNGLSSAWLDSLMRREMGKVEGVTYHYYSGLNNSGPSYNFTQAQYYSRLQLAWAMENNMRTCETIMNRYDPNYTVGLMVDEWGAWYSGIPGMGSCYQQNTCRDAVIASMHFNIFNNRCRRVKMALVAQPVNVIQSLLLTKNPPTTDMIKTPTFYVFKMYKVHQEAKMVPLTLTTSNNQNVPLISASASVDSTGKLHISMCNTHISAAQNVVITLANGPGYTSCTGTVINGPEYGSYNDYNGVEPVNIKALSSSSYTHNGNTITVSVPAHAVVTLALTPGTGIAAHARCGGDVWSVKPCGKGSVRILGPVLRTVPLTLAILGIDGRTMIASEIVTMPPGQTGTVWRPRNGAIGPGVYFVKITAGANVFSRRIVLAR
ncbi:MAG: hypothetical protein JW768_11625 [Chitinispirillaceae bacterium]|nr:hypothetical protein [Chitinispirillaceae bacterium]